MLQPFLRSTGRLKVLTILPLFALLGACSQAVFDPAGDVARQQRDIIYISTGLMLLIIVPVMILIVLFAWRYRKGKGGTYDPEFDHSTSLELVIWAAPLLIIIMLGALTWSSTHLLDPFRPLDKAEADRDPKASREAPLRIQVVSLDWKWLFIYPDQGIATVNDLVLPVGRQVRFDITSSNMMNTFYAPTMAGMIYAMPGMQSSLHAVLDRPVDSVGFSANYSGAGFSNMRFRIRGVDDAAFAQWVDGARAANRSLDIAAYTELAKPSEDLPASHYSAFDPDLFRRVVERCVQPGTPCMSELMDHGQHEGGMPPRGSSAAQGDRPEGQVPERTRESGTRPVPGNPAPGPGVINPNPHQQHKKVIRPKPAPSPATAPAA